VRAALPHTEGGFRSFDEVAGKLGLSARTLRRRLSGDGLSFASLVDDERKARALVLLRKEALSLDEVANRLGYADGSTFARAFQRWTGDSPAVYRREMRAAPKR